MLMLSILLILAILLILLILKMLLLQLVLNKTQSFVRLARWAAPLCQA